MTAEVVMTAIVAAAGATGLALQLVRIRRFGVLGVSPLTWLLIAAVNLNWAALMWVRGFIAVAVIDLLFALVSGAVAVAVPAPARLRLGVLAVGGVTTATQLLAPDLGAAIAIIGTVVMFAPQSVLVLRALWRGTATGGVSAGAWAINAGNAAAWALWGLAAGNMVSVAANVPVFILAVTVTVAAVVNQIRTKSRTGGRTDPVRASR